MAIYVPKNFGLECTVLAKRNYPPPAIFGGVVRLISAWRRSKGLAKTITVVFLNLFLDLDNATYGPPRNRKKGQKALKKIKSSQLPFSIGKR